MPISAELYSIRIGCFINRVPKKVKVKPTMKPKYKTSFKRTGSLVLKLILLSCLALQIPTQSSPSPSLVCTDVRPASWTCSTLSPPQVCNHARPASWTHSAVWGLLCSHLLHTWEKNDREQNVLKRSWIPLSNLLAHYTYGNRSGAGRGIRLASWNAGSC